MYVYGSIFDGVMYVLLGDVCSVRTYCLNCYALNDLIPLIIILLYQYSYDTILSFANLFMNIFK
jgi:hypothetical protein